MKALRNWMRDNEKTREFLADEEGRAIPAKVGDQMRDMILAMSDVLDAVSAFRDCKVSDEEAMLKTHDELYKAHTAATSVIKEVTG